MTGRASGVCWPLRPGVGARRVELAESLQLQLIMSVHGPMQSIVARISVKPEACEIFESLLLAAIDRVKQEERGTLVYVLLKDPKIMGVYCMIELYDSVDAVSVHNKNNENLLNDLVKCLAGRPEISMTSVVGSPGLKTGSSSFGVIASLPVKDLSKFSKASLHLIDEVQTKEEGCLMYCMSMNARASGVLFTELYADAKALQHHSQTPYFLAANQAQGRLLNGRPRIDVLTVVGGFQRQSAPTKAQL